MLFFLFHWQYGGKELQLSLEYSYIIEIANFIGYLTRKVSTSEIKFGISLESGILLGFPLQLFYISTIKYSIKLLKSVLKEISNKIE